MGLRAVDACARLNISLRTVHRIMQRFLQTGSVAAYKSKTRKHCFTVEQEIFIIGIIFENPAMHLDEVVAEIDESLHITVSMATCSL